MELEQIILDEVRALRVDVKEIRECVHTRVSLDEYNTNKAETWSAINLLRRFVYIGIGICLTLSVLLPLLLSGVIK